MRASPLGVEVVPHDGQLRALLHRQGTPIGPNDLWPVGHGLSANLTLVTGKERVFRRVPTLRVENWMR